MQIMVTHGSMSRTQIYQVSVARIVLVVGAAVLALLLLAGLAYHALFMAAAREGWPVAGEVVRTLMQDQLAQRDRYVRENLDAIAQKVGELQAKLVQLESLSERVSGLAGLKPDEVRLEQTKALGAGKGGPYLPMRPGMRDLDQAVKAMDEQSSAREDVFTLIESRLFEKKMLSMMVPSSTPVLGPVSSGFGFRSDPFTGRPALHAGLDFPGPVGTPIKAAAGGVVVAAETNASYGNMVMVDHGNGLVTRYGHTSRMLVRSGDLVRRGQVIAEIGSTGRSTGPHLHFEVHVDGVPQDPAKFLFGKGNAVPASVASVRD